MRGVTRAGRALQPKLGASFPAMVEDSMEGVTQLHCGFRSFHVTAWFFWKRGYWSSAKITGVPWGTWSHWGQGVDRGLAGLYSLLVILCPMRITGGWIWEDGREHPAQVLCGPDKEAEHREGKGLSQVAQQPALEPEPTPRMAAGWKGSLG